MTRAELEHAIRAACDVADDTEVYVFGSQAILGQYPNAPHALTQSMEADVVPKNKPENCDLVDGSLGELSQFQDLHGFYVHGLSLEAVTVPEGWKDRVVAVQNENTHQCTGWCIEAHDLAASKLVAFRDKDRSFVRVLLIERLIDADTLIARIGTLAVSPDQQDRLITWVEATCQEIN